MNTNVTAVTLVCNDVSATAANLVAQIVKSQEGELSTSKVDIFTRIYSSEFSNEINGTPLIFPSEFEKYDSLEVDLQPEITFVQMGILRRRLVNNEMMDLDIAEFANLDRTLTDTFTTSLKNARQTIADLVNAVSDCKDMIYLAQTAAYAAADLFKLEMRTGANLLINCDLLSALKLRQIMMDLRLIEIDALKYLLEFRISR